MVFFIIPTNIKLNGICYVLGFKLRTNGWGAFFTHQSKPGLQVLPRPQSLPMTGPSRLAHPTPYPKTLQSRVLGFSSLYNPTVVVVHSLYLWASWLLLHTAPPPFPHMAWAQRHVHSVLSQRFLPLAVFHIWTFPPSHLGTVMFLFFFFISLFPSLCGHYSETH